MRLLSQKKLVAGSVAVVIIVILAIAVGLHIKANHSRTAARRAVATYNSAAHKYLSDVATQLAVLGDFNNSIDKTVSAEQQLKKLEANKPQLQIVKGAGAKLAEYEQAGAEQAKISALSRSIDKANASYQPYLAIISAYNSLDDVQTNISNGKLSSSDQSKAIKDVIITPLTAARSDFQKVRQPTSYQTIAQSLNGLFDDYINAGNSLLAAIENGSTSSQSYSFSGQLYALYDPIVNISKTALQPPARLADQAKTLGATF